MVREIGAGTATPKVQFYQNDISRCVNYTTSTLSELYLLTNVSVHRAVFHYPSPPAHEEHQLLLGLWFSIYTFSFCPPQYSHLLIGIRHDTKL